MLTYGARVKGLHAAIPFRADWSGRCDHCDQLILDSEECWFWADAIFSPVLHPACFVGWEKALPAELRAAISVPIERGLIELTRHEVRPIDPAGYEGLGNRARPTSPADVGTFLDYVNHWSDEVSTPSERLNELYESITIWEVYKRLLPQKPHAPYRPEGETSVACPHESGKNSLSMWINAVKGVWFCAHAWEGGNKMALYCEIRGYANHPSLFHKLKQAMVFEFRGENPYATPRR